MSSTPESDTARSESDDLHAAAEIGQLARHVTADSAKYNPQPAPSSEHNALNPAPDSKLDPRSLHFNSNAWSKAFIDLYESDPDSAPRRITGIAFRDLSVSGRSSLTHYQQSTGNMLPNLAKDLVHAVSPSSSDGVKILRDFEGIINPGEMLLVLGPPGSGCSTFLKTLSGQTEGLTVSKNSQINFRGISPKQMFNWFRGDILYNAEIDVHLPPLTVGDTLEFAARARIPAKVPGGFTGEQYARVMRDVIMAIFGISHTINTKVGNELIRGVSGGERKRVSIAEASLTGAKFQCWDNSTRGLDSGNAISFCKTLRTQADVMNVAAVVAIYQTPQTAYDTFDKVTVLYEGRQIYFGRIEDAKAYFEALGFECPDRQTTADFLSSMTAPAERRVRSGFETLVPRTPDDFAARWKASKERLTLISHLDAYDQQHPADDRLKEFHDSRQGERTRALRMKSPYTISYVDQVRLCLWRGYRRMLADPGFTIASLIFNAIMGFVVGSAFYNLDDDAGSFYYRGTVIFFSLLLNAFSSELEVLLLYAQRPVVEKHKRYAFYHQSAEAVSGYLWELPYKTANIFMFNIIVYFLANLRREAGPFFFFTLTTYLGLLSMSGIFRTFASIFRTPYQAMIPVSLVTIGVMTYSGFTIPTDFMPGWSRWMNYINPLAYAFEALMANEFSGRQFECTNFVPSGPGYDGVPISDRTCAVVGAEFGSTMVSGEKYIELTFKYFNSHKWRNVGILFGFVIFFFFTYILAAEFARPPKSKGEVLVFRRGKQSSMITSLIKQDVESQSDGKSVAEKSGKSEKSLGDDIKKLSPSTCGQPIFHWEDICYDITIKGENRRILDHVDGWVQPGVVTALMGVSGAGKTTLLDALATRLTMGVITGETMVNGIATDNTFPHRVGYCQQQDLHLNTMTVREALEFSAVLRQSGNKTRAEKLAYIDEVIDLLDMEDFVDAVIGVPGEGLNIEQRKRLTIGVELAARPQLLVFLDEPTSGLDSQTSWAICDLIEKLAKSGQAVLCTIHQPSAMLFSRFDRLLLLQPGGKTVYFGDIGPESRTMINYFERNGAPKCPPNANPAEWMLTVTTPAPDTLEWFDIWRESPEYRATKQELLQLRGMSESPLDPNQEDPALHREFVAPFTIQFREVFVRVVKHFWRSPVYIWSKFLLMTLVALYTGFSYEANNSLQGLQNQLWSFFLVLAIVSQLGKQIMPMFTPQRALYEVRERPSKVYRWSTFILSNIIIELFWNTIASVGFFFAWYYPVGFVQNTTAADVHIRGFTTFLFIWAFLLWSGTLAQFLIAAIESPEIAGIPLALIVLLCMAFSGVGVAHEDLPAIWRDFMYNVSPMTYLVSGALSTSLHGADINCKPNEVVPVMGPLNQTCGQYLAPFIEATTGYVMNSSATSECGYCLYSKTDEFLAGYDVHYDDRWRNFGIVLVYIAFNGALACGLYWLSRVPKKQGLKRS